MDGLTKDEDGLDEDVANYNSQRKWENLSNGASYEDKDENHLQNMPWEGMGTTQFSNEQLDEDKRALSNLQKLSMEHGRPPFPDFQFELLDNEADTDGSGCELSLATGTRKKPPSRMDSWEDNWLFQERSPKARTPEGGGYSLASTKAYETIDEQPDPPTNAAAENNSDASECSEDDKWNEVRRVQRPCVQTSSSSSASGDSESISSDSAAENNVFPENEFDDNIPILDANHSMTESPDSAEAMGQNPVNSATDNFEVESDKTKFDEQGEIDHSCEVTSPRTKNQIDVLEIKAVETPQDEVMSDDSIKQEVLKQKGEKASLSRPVNPLLPILMTRRTPSPHGTRSCASEDSSSDEFEKNAAAYKPRRRASWCYLEKASVAKKKSKRRPAQTLRVDEDEPEADLKGVPMVDQEETLVGLERQMLRRDAHHSSFRSTKASPNFVLNPLYVPDGEGMQNQRRNPIEEPVEIHQLCLQRYESGYSSCSPDSFTNQNNHCHVQLDERRANAEGRIGNLAPEVVRRPNFSSSGQSHAKSDPSFLW